MTPTTLAAGGRAVAHDSCTRPSDVDVALGQRAVVVGDLSLPSPPTPASRVAADDLAAMLDRWEGDGTVVVCGALVHAPCSQEDSVRSTLSAHGGLAAAIRRFTSDPSRRLVTIHDTGEFHFPGGCGMAQVLRELGAEVADAVDLRLECAAGPRTVLVRHARLVAPEPCLSAEDPPRWLEGIGDLEDPMSAGRFVTSRALYRRVSRLFVPLGALPALAAVFLDRAVAGADTVTWADRVALGALALVGVLLVVALIASLASRVAWRALGGGDLPFPFRFRQRKVLPLLTERQPELLADHPASHGLEIGDRPAIDAAREAVELGAAGMIVGGGLGAELMTLTPGFLGSPGTSAELVREHPGRFGLPPVFLRHRQSGWIELEAGSDLHVRLLLDDVEVPRSAFAERIATADHAVKGQHSAGRLHPVLAASWPHGPVYPPPPDVARDRIRTRRTRRIAAASIFVAGFVDLLEAVTPPLRGRLHLVTQLLPLGVSQTAGALVALAGVGLMMLARGARRGQRRSWVVSIVLLALSIGLHLAHDAAVGGVILSLAVLAFLLVERARFGAATDPGSARSALLALVVGALTTVGAATLAIELSGVSRHRRLPSLPDTFVAVTERLVGLHTVGLPDRIDDWMYPSLLTVGATLAVVALMQLTRPVVDRRLSSAASISRRHTAEARARDIVRRHGSGTLDYFALRDDKQWFFHRDSLVAYAVYGGVCLVSPDPIGPRGERVHVWDAFHRYADRHGWAVGVMAAAEDWLPVYRDSGMRNLYIGDEAVVDVRGFSLDGGKMKGLRQAVGRVGRHGYTAEVLSPTELAPQTVSQLTRLVELNRRGDNERGFSMMLGRLFDPRDDSLLVTVVASPDGAPVAVCQFIPSPAIGGYSLDLMRRDPGEHPNGLLDFALVSTIAHLREQGCRGLSLNFAAMRSVLDGECGDTIAQRVRRWALKKLSGPLQIESLWRFNAKYEPSWLPRYVVWDSAEQFVPTAVQILRAESLTDIPFVGRLLATSTARSSSVKRDSAGLHGRAPATR